MTQETIKTINPMWNDVECFMRVREQPHEFNPRRFTQAWEKREAICKIYAWGIASPDAIQFIAKHADGKIVEMGAGNGYWGWQLSQLGVDVDCYDIAPPDKIYTNHWHSPRFEQSNDFKLMPAQTWYPVNVGTYTDLVGRDDRTLFLYWPPYDDDFAYNCLLYYRGNKLIYIGEGEGGCTGDDRFFAELEISWECVAFHHMPQWEGIHDNISVYERIRPGQGAQK